MMTKKEMSDQLKCRMLISECKGRNEELPCGLNTRMITFRAALSKAFNHKRGTTARAKADAYVIDCEKAMNKVGAMLWSQQQAVQEKAVNPVPDEGTKTMIMSLVLTGERELLPALVNLALIRGGFRQLEPTALADYRYEYKPLTEAEQKLSEQEQVSAHQSYLDQEKAFISCLRERACLPVELVPCANDGLAVEPKDMTMLNKRWQSNLTEPLTEEQADAKERMAAGLNRFRTTWKLPPETKPQYAEKQQLVPDISDCERVQRDIGKMPIEIQTPVVKTMVGELLAWGAQCMGRIPGNLYKEIREWQRVTSILNPWLGRSKKKWSVLKNIHSTAVSRITAAWIRMQETKASKVVRDEDMLKSNPSINVMLQELRDKYNYTRQRMPDDLKTAIGNWQVCSQDLLNKESLDTVTRDGMIRRLLWADKLIRGAWQEQCNQKPTEKSEAAITTLDMVEQLRQHYVKAPVAMSIPTALAIEDFERTRSALGVRDVRKEDEQLQLHTEHDDAVSRVQAAWRRMKYPLQVPTEAVEERRLALDEWIPTSSGRNKDEDMSKTPSMQGMVEQLRQHYEQAPVAMPEHVVMAIHDFERTHASLGVRGVRTADEQRQLQTEHEDALYRVQTAWYRMKYPPTLADMVPSGGLDKGQVIPPFMAFHGGKSTWWLHMAQERIKAGHTILLVAPDPDVSAHTAALFEELVAGVDKALGQRQHEETESRCDMDPSADVRAAQRIKEMYADSAQFGVPYLPPIEMQPWSEQGIAVLLLKRRRGAPVAEIARDLQRTPAAINAKLHVLKRAEKMAERKRKT